LLKTNTETLETAKADILKFKAENDMLLNSKEKIDVTISELNPSKLEEEIEFANLYFQLISFYFENKL
jgi:hypothetical protein